MTWWLASPSLDHKVPGLRWNSTCVCTTLHCTEPFIITLPSSRYDLNNVERDIKQQIIIIIINWSEHSSCKIAQLHWHAEAQELAVLFHYCKINSEYITCLTVPLLCAVWDLLSFSLDWPQSLVSKYFFFYNPV